MQHNRRDPFRIFKLVPGAGVEPARGITPGDFKSPASTSSATRAFVWIGILSRINPGCKIKKGHCVLICGGK